MKDDDHSADAGTATATDDTPAAAGESLIERARRILTRGPRPDDHLPAAPGAVARADAHIAEILAKSGVVIAPEARQWMIDNETLGFHCEGEMVLCWRTGRGVVLLARGFAEITTVLTAVPREERTATYPSDMAPYGHGEIATEYP